MSGSSYYYCVNLSTPDTFVFHKPLGFGSTMWAINFVIQGSGDSLVFIPTTVGSFSIDCVWNSNAVTCPFYLFNTVPSHPMMQILNGGNFNTARDTVRMCAATVNIQATGGTSGYVYKQWTGPNGFFTATVNATITAPGMYVFERGNPCGITRDSIYFLSLPYVLPTLGPADTTFCNDTVNLLLNPGPGWNYTWTGGSYTGLHTQTLQLINGDIGTYSVQLSNACLNGNRSINVHAETYPIPAMNHMVGPVLCADSVVTLNPAPGFHYDTYLWSTNAITDSIQISGLTTGGGLFTVTVTKGACSATATDAFYQFFQAPQRPEICIVTVDSATQKNMIVWTNDSEPPIPSFTYSPTALYNIYKDNDTINPIGSINVHDTHMFIDTNSSPSLQSATYYIQAVDDCEVGSRVSYYHQTILLQTSQGSQPGQVNLSWNQYQDQSNNLHITNYDVYRGSSAATLSFYRNVPAPVNPNLSVLIVDTVSSQQYYLIMASKAGGCDPTPHIKSITDGKIRSNIKQGVTSIGINSITQSTFPIYPNPSNGIFHIEGDNVDKIEVFDNVGRLLLKSGNQQTIDLSAFSNGVYFAKIYYGKGVGNIKLVVK